MEGEETMRSESTTALVLLNFGTEYKVYTGWLNELTILPWVFQWHVCNYIAYIISRVRRYLRFSLNQKIIQRQILAVAKVSKLSRYHCWKPTEQNISSARCQNKTRWVITS